MSNSVIVKLQALDELTPGLKKAKAELESLSKESVSLDLSLKELQKNKKGIVKGAIESDIDGVKKLRAEIEKLEMDRNKARRGDQKSYNDRIKKKELELEALINAEIKKQTRLVKEAKDAKAVAAEKARNIYKQEIASLQKKTAATRKATVATKKETAAVDRATSSRIKEDAVRRSAMTTLVRHIRRIESLVVAYYALTTAYRTTFGAGVELNRQYENIELGLAGILASKISIIDATGKELDAFAKLNITQAMTADTLEKIKKASADTPATFLELAGFYQQAIGHALAAGDAFGTSIDQISDNTITLTKRMSNLGASMGMAMDRINEEIRSIMSGNASTDSLLAMVLFGSPGDANQAIREAKTRTDGLSETLLGALKQFEAMEGIMTYDRALARLRIEIEKIQKAAAEPLFEDITEGAIDLARYLKENGEGISESFKTAYSAAKLLASSIDTLAAAFLAYKATGWIQAGITALNASLTTTSLTTMGVAKKATIASAAMKQLAVTSAFLKTNAWVLGVTAAVTAFTLLADRVKSVKDRLAEIQSMGASDVAERIVDLRSKGRNIKGFEYQELQRLERQYMKLMGLNKQLIESNSDIEDLTAKAIFTYNSSVLKDKDKIFKMLNDRIGVLAGITIATNANTKATGKLGKEMDAHIKLYERHLKISSDILAVLDPYQSAMDAVNKKYGNMYDYMVQIKAPAEDIAEFLKQWKIATDEAEKNVAGIRNKISSVPLPETMRFDDKYFKDTGEKAKAEFQNWSDTLNSSISDALVNAIQDGDVLGAVKGLGASVASSMIQASTKNLVTGAAFSSNENLFSMGGLGGIAAAVGLTAIGSLFGEERRKSLEEKIEDAKKAIDDQTEKITSRLDAQIGLMSGFGLGGSASSVELGKSTETYRGEVAKLQRQSEAVLNVFALYEEDKYEMPIYTESGEAYAELVTGPAQFPGGKHMRTVDIDAIIAFFEEFPEAADAAKFADLKDDYITVLNDYATAMAGVAGEIESTVARLEDLSDSLTGSDFFQSQAVDRAKMKIEEYAGGVTGSKESFTGFINELIQGLDSAGISIDQLQSSLLSDDTAIKAEAVRAMETLLGATMEVTAEDAINLIDSIELVGKSFVDAAGAAEKSARETSRAAETAAETARKAFDQAWLGAYSPLSMLQKTEYSRQLAYAAAPQGGSTAIDAAYQALQTAAASATRDEDIISEFRNYTQLLENQVADSTRSDIVNAIMSTNEKLDDLIDRTERLENATYASA